MANNDAFTMRCADCGTRNRVPAEKVGETARCGRCGSALDTRVLGAGHPVMVADRNFQKDVLLSPLPVLAFFWAPWCPSCKQTAPVVEGFAAEARGRMRVAKVNVDAAPQTADRYDIRGVPFLMVFDNGQVRESLPAVMDRHELMTRMARFL